MKKYNDVGWSMETVIKIKGKYLEGDKECSDILALIYGQEPEQVEYLEPEADLDTNVKNVIAAAQMLMKKTVQMEKTC